MGSVGFGVGLFGRWCLRLALALPATGFGFRSPFDGMNDFDVIGDGEPENFEERTIDSSASRSSARVQYMTCT